MNQRLTTETELDEARETVAIPLGNGIEIPLNLSDSSSTGFKGVGQYANHPGYYVAQPSMREVAEVDPRVAELPPASRRGQTVFLGRETDPRKAAYRRAYVMKNIGTYLDKFFGLPSNQQVAKNWWPIVDAPIPFPDELFSNIPDNGKEVISLGKEIRANRAQGKPVKLDPAKEKTRLSALEIFNALKADPGISAALDDLTEIGRKSAYKRLQDVAMKKQADPEMKINMSDLARGIKIDQGKLEEAGQLDESINRIRYLSTYLRG